MIPIANTKIVVITAPELKDDGSPTIAYADTAGWSHARFLFVVGATDIATTAAPTITESNVAGSGYVAITSPTTAATSAAITADDDGKAYAIDVDLTRGARKRYLKPTFVCGNGSTGTNICIVCILTRADSGAVNESTEVTNTTLFLAELISA